MTSPIGDSDTLQYSVINNTTVSGLIEQQEERKHNTASKDNNTPQGDSSTEMGINTLREIFV